MTHLLSGQTAGWIALLAALAILLAVDLLLVRGRKGRMTARSAAVWSLAWVAISFAFAAVLLVLGRPDRPRPTSPATSWRSRSRWTTPSSS